MAMRETGNLGYQHATVSQVPRKAFLDVLKQGDSVVNRLYTPELAAKDCMDFLQINKFMGKNTWITSIDEPTITKVYLASQTFSGLICSLRDSVSPIQS